jgi:hypothetical protein
MADGTQLEQAQAPLGDIIATDDITDGGVADGQKAQRIKIGVGSDNNYSDIHSGNPLPIQQGITNPTISHDFALVVAAGSPSDLDSAQISSGLTGKLVAVLMCSSVPLKGEIKTVLNGIEGPTLITMFSKSGQNALLALPNKNFITQVEDVTVGFDGFRLTVTNLDNENAADVYATFFYDEE